jgi:predicted DNA-binding transcriptional regulator YafY
MIDNQEYLDAYCRTSEDFRSFRIDRIKNCEITDVQQDMPFELVDRTVPGIDFDIAITSQPRKVLEFFNIPLSNGDSKIVEFSNHAFNLDWIIRSVFSLNASAILTKPSAIREQIAIRAEKALKLYI